MKLDKQQVLDFISKLQVVEDKSKVEQLLDESLKDLQEVVELETEQGKVKAKLLSSSDSKEEKDGKRFKINISVFERIDNQEAIVITRRCEIPTNCIDIDLNTLHC